MTGLTDVHAPFDRAVALLADLVADYYAAAKRCEEIDRTSAAIERRIESDAVRIALIQVLADALAAEGVAASEAHAVAIARADELIHAATARRGEKAGAQ